MTRINYMLNQTKPLEASRLMLLFFLSFFLTESALFAQTDLGTITTANASCNFTTTVCNNDTIEFEPNNTTDFTNFKWYYGSVAPANEILGADPSKNVIFVSGAKIQVVTPYGTYILTGEYVNPSGLNCPTLNDTITINYFPEPQLATVPDTICTDASETSDLASLVTDGNTTGGTLTFYTSYANAFNATSAVTSPVSPTATTKYYVRSETSNGCYDIDSIDVVVRCMSLGNFVWYDTNNNGSIDGGENGIDGVTVNLYLDADNDGMLTGAELTTIVATATTSSGGQYLFEDLREGNYIVGIPASSFGSGGVLENLYSSGTSIGADGTKSETAAPDPDANDADTDDNGVLLGTGDVFSAPITLLYTTEPTGESPDNSSNPNDHDDNLTVDFGFYGMSIGSYVFMDINNNGTYAAADDMVSAGTTVNLRSSDGTLIATTVTGADGRYLFTNLPEGDYIVGVELPTGKQSSDDIATSTTPLSTDNDDNGVNLVGSEIRSNVFTLDAGAMNTGESDQAQTTAAGMGNPAITDNPLTPDANSELHIDFGLKPDCHTIENASADQAFCVGLSGANITTETSTDGSQYTIRWVRFDTPQTGNAMYTGGTDLETVTPTGGSAPYTATYTFDTADFPNTSTTTSQDYYVYAVLSPAPADPTCRPFEEIKMTVYPQPTASPETLTQCETTTGGGTSIFDLNDATTTVLNGQTGMTVTYHETQVLADAGTSAITSSTSPNATTVYARVENANGCYSTSEVTLNVDVNPAFTLSLPDVCPGDDPTVEITLGAGAEASPNATVNGGTPFAISTLSTQIILETANGINPGATNTVILTNSTTCSHTETIAVPEVVQKVCIPVVIRKIND